MTDKERVVDVLKKFGRPVGWYPIAQTLSMRGVILDDRLPIVLSKLVVEGTIVCADTDGRPKYVLSE